MGEQRVQKCVERDALVRTFIGTLLELLVVKGLLNKIENDVVERSIGARNGFGVHFGRLAFQIRKFTLDKL